MFLSVCIPVYNFDVRNLVSDLRKEINENNLDVEIILIDDGSNKEIKKINKEISHKTNHFIFLEKNIGRSAVRNLFLKYTNGDFLLFLDCDAKITRSNFIRSYLSILEEHDLELVYGNFSIDTKYKKTLRNQFSMEREIATDFSSADFKLFKSINFLIKKELFENNQFNENLKNYGYEDFLFAQKLKEKGVEFKMINNPVIHSDHISNANFLEKTKISVRTLIEISKDKNNEKYIRKIKLYRFGKIFRKYGFGLLFKYFYQVFEKNIEKNLNSKSPNLFYFDLFKLNYFLEISNKKISQ